MKRIIALVLAGILLTMSMSTVSGCLNNGPADWDKLYEHAVKMGYQLTQEKFIVDVVGDIERKDDKGNAKLSAYELTQKYGTYEGTEFDWIEWQVLARLDMGMIIFDYYEYHMFIIHLKYSFNESNYKVLLSGINKVSKIVECELASDITPPHFFYDAVIVVKQPSRENILRAISEFAKIDFVGLIFVFYG